MADSGVPRRLHVARAGARQPTRYARAASTSSGVISCRTSSSPSGRRFSSSSACRPALAAGSRKRCRPRPDASRSSRCPLWVGDVRRLARPGALRRGARAPADPAPARARAATCDRHPLLVVRVAGRAPRALGGRPRRLRVRGVRAVGAARARARAGARAALRLLCGCARARLGAVAPRGSAARRDDDGGQSSRSSSSPSSSSGSCGSSPRRSGVRKTREPGAHRRAPARPRVLSGRRLRRRSAKEGSRGSRSGSRRAR